MKRNRSRLPLSDRVFLHVDTAILLLFGVVVLYPLLFILGASFRGGISTLSASIIPKAISLAGYKAIFEFRAIWTGYRNTLFYMTAGTAINLVMTILCAYPLSRADFPLRNAVMGVCVVTMYFSGGLIPGYLLLRDLHMLDTPWAMLIPGAMSVYNMIVMRTYFQTQIPRELLESAQLDGAGNTRFLLGIALPISGPMLAVIALFYAVGHWNSYFPAMVFLSDRSLYPLQLILREILITSTANPMETIVDVDAQVSLEARKNVMKYAVIVISSLPMMILYPFVQKYFVKGVMIGAIKG